MRIFLHVFLHPAGKGARLPHSDEGIASLLVLLREFTIERVVLESTGGLQRRLVRALQEAKYAVSVVNPERIWAYRRLVGRATKTDRIDARLIAEYGATMKPAASVALTETQQGMRELTSRRDQLIAAIAAEKKRRRRVSQEVVRASLEAQIAHLSTLISTPSAAAMAAMPPEFENRIATIEDYMATNDEYIVEAARQAAEAVMEAYRHAGPASARIRASVIAIRTVPPHIPAATHSGIPAADMKPTVIRLQVIRPTQASRSGVRVFKRPEKKK